MEMRTFCDASEMASSAVSCLRIVNNTGEVQVTFVLRKAKLTAAHATITHRLELWAAVLEVEMTELVHKELEQNPDSVTYYSDSKFILGYLNHK